MNDYSNHVFLSYSRSGHVPDWITNHFLPTLSALLGEELDEDPKVFKDDQIDKGDSWPERLERELQGSKCMVAIWNPKYFRSKWCLAEWETMRKREDIFGMRSKDNPSGLVYPIVFSNGTSFPESACTIQYTEDFRKFAYPYRVFKEHTLYLDFHDAVSKVAKGILSDAVKGPSIRPRMADRKTQTTGFQSSSNLFKIQMTCRQLVLI